MTTSYDWTGRVGRTWAAEWQRTDRAFAGLTPHLDAAIRAAAPGGPFRAIDIGCGAGSTAIALAGTRADASVIGIDLSPDLLAIAQQRGGDHINLRFLTGDVTERAQDLAPIDLFASRHGVMFFAEPVAAFSALHAAARPNAPLVFSCFRDRADNPWASDLVAEVTGTPNPDPGTGYAPGPFGFADAAATQAILAAAGWDAQPPTRIDFAYRVGEGDDPVADAIGFFQRIGPIAAALRDSADADAALARLKTALERYTNGAAVECPASAWLWRAHARPQGAAKGE